MNKTGFLNKLKGTSWVNYINIFTIFIVFAILFSIFVPRFFTIANLDNFFRQATIMILLSIGMTLLLLSGNFDLSVEGQVAMIAMLVARLINMEGLPVGWGILLAPIIGMAIGLFNGVLCTKIPSFIITLGTLVMTRGASLLINRNRPIVGFPDSLLAITRTQFLGTQILVFYALLAGAIAILVSKKTTFGRQVFAIGGNREAARSSGIPINKNIVVLFTLMGFLCGFSSLLLMGRVNAAHPLAMEGASLEVVTAVIIGGTSLYGGMGTVFGSIIGAGFITMLTIVFNLLGVPSAWKQVILGFVLILVVLFDYIKKRLQERSLQ